ncbi:hypothetical protein COT66_02095 [Candidatus Shapirobacteria bacterium CG09_land_8_20_14_0_10_49_15]|uniref:Uncharacterized protein n=1 Tax=Candidatus Shapirobacteria bacterium CG09_land_8_20_14_0_10_49_15 TaxID=1974482 RepID=A0A2M6XAV5_9BACT|nr:MAG: hypothetical protein COT66_02095 [Candidatus Shapirobacteria bacterium CG09_land_8_20_14_0_10_49_15]
MVGKRGGEKMKFLQKIGQKANHLAMASVVYAADIDLRPQGTWSPLGNVTFGGLISALIRLALIIVALVAFAFLILGGVKWITSGGDKEATSGAQKTITAALIGLVIVFAAWAILQLVQTFFGINILTFVIPTIN